MSDFETRLTEALTSGADEAPTVDRLADGARARACARRRTGTALVAAGAVVVLAVPAGVVALKGGDEGSGDHDRVANEPQQAKDDWQTVEHEGVVVDLPAQWACGAGKHGARMCEHDGEELILFASARFDPLYGPGLVDDGDGAWTGYVYAGEWAVSVLADDKQTALRVLASAREPGQEAPDVSAGFRTVAYDGLTIDVPADWREGVLSDWCIDDAVRGWIQRPDTASGVDVDCPSPSTGYGVRFGGGDVDDGIRERGEPQYPEGSWAGVAIAPDANGVPVGYVQVVAPTQGLAELIGGSLRAE